MSTSARTYPLNLFARPRRTPSATTGCSAAIALLVATLATGGASSLAHAASKGPSAPALTLAAKKKAVLAADPDLVRMFGGHVIIGYERASQLTPLLQSGAIGGVFVTRRNSRRRSQKALGDELDSLRRLAHGNTARPLWIATDQEGGLVAHLSPPLRRQSSLGDAIAKAASREAREAISREFAQTQAVGLTDLGVNLNFAPVVDLKPQSKLRRDRRTHLIHRAISNEPNHVIEAAHAYCDTLAGWRILCTLKHFPGLQGADADTHVREATLDRSREQLEAGDWMPFWSVTATTPAAIMIGHATLDAIDGDKPASASSPVISGLLRGEWGYDGLIITDDLDMGAINKRPGGIGQGAVESLSAGADILLLTHDGDVVFEILHALLEAHAAGRFDGAKLAQSRARLDRFAARFAPREITWPKNFPMPSPAPRRAAAVQ